MSRIAIYGGCFNPIHNGHLIIAQEIWQLFRLDKVIFVPTANPPHKRSQEVIEASHRLAMALLAVEDNPYFMVSEVEIKRGGASYTIDTLRCFREEFGKAARLYFIIGSDAFMELDTWKQATELFDLASFIVIERPGFSLQDARLFWNKFSSEMPSQMIRLPLCAPVVFREDCKVFFVQGTLLNISSSGIRKNVQEGNSLHYLVPEAVKEYIAAQGLYNP